MLLCETHIPKITNLQFTDRGHSASRAIPDTHKLDIEATAKRYCGWQVHISCVSLSHQSIRAAAPAATLVIRGHGAGSAKTRTQLRGNETIAEYQRLQVRAYLTRVVAQICSLRVSDS